MKRNNLAAISLFAIATSALCALSAFADSQPLQRTGDIQYVVRRNPDTRAVNGATVEGRITSIQSTGSDNVLILSSGEALRVRRGTRVFWQGERYDVTDLEVGDRVRAVVRRGVSAREFDVRSIEVVQSVSDPQTYERYGDRDEDRVGGTLNGEIDSVNPRNDSFLMTTIDGRAVRVDAYRATGLDVNRLHAGDRVTVTGSFDSMGNFRAMRVDRGTRGAYRGDVRRNDDRKPRDHRFDRQNKKSDDDSDDDDDEDEDND